MGEGDPSQSTPKPTRWWQWFLVYPAVATTLLASVPTYLEFGRSQSLSVAFGKSADATVQDDLWQLNLDCTAAPFDWWTTPRNIQVDATICESGDVFVRAKVPNSASGSRSFYRWVPVSVVTRQASFSLVGTAHAAEVPFDLWASEKAVEAGPAQTALGKQVAQARVLCQRWIRRGLLLRRIATGRGCIDEVVNTYTGYVESARAAPCNNRC